MNSLFPFSHLLSYKCPYVSFQRMFPLLPCSSADVHSINFYTYGISQDITTLNPELNEITKKVAGLFLKKTSRIGLARYKQAFLVCTSDITARKNANVDIHTQSSALAVSLFQ